MYDCLCWTGHDLSCFVSGLGACFFLFFFSFDHIPWLPLIFVPEGKIFITWLWSYLQEGLWSGWMGGDTANVTGV